MEGGYRGGGGLQRGRGGEGGRSEGEEKPCLHLTGSAAWS